MSPESDVHNLIAKQECLGNEISVEYSLAKKLPLHEARMITIQKVTEKRFGITGGVDKLEDHISPDHPIATLVVDGAIVDATRGEHYSAFFDFFLESDSFWVTFSFFSPFHVPLEEMEERVQDAVHSFDLDLLDVIRPRSLYHPDENFWVVVISAPVLNSPIGEFIGKLRKISSDAANYDRSIPNVALVMNILRSNDPDIMLGFKESQHLEFKGPAYELCKGSPWKQNLCEDIARFANSEHGGVIIIGFSTKKRDGSDTAVKMTPVPHNSTRGQSYGQVADHHIYPPIEGLRFESFGAEGGEIFCVVIPTQRDQNKPFLVQGGLVGGKYREGVISIPRRRGEESIPITAREIHRLISIGRRVEKGMIDENPKTGSGA